MSRETGSPLFSILIVDDEPKNIQVLGSLLKENGYEVEFALNGEKALNWMGKKSFDLVLLDVMMPGMDGYEVCREIKSDVGIQHTPVIFLTAKTETEDVVRGFEAGGADYITKPFRKLELLARVKVHLDMKRLRGLIPICANCKDVRDDTGAWKQLETYIEQNSLALFSHGMCPKCLEKLYGKEEWYQNRSKKNRP